MKFAAACARLDVRPYDVVETANIPYIHILPLALKCWVRGKPFLVTWHEFLGHGWSSYMGGPAAVVYRAVEWVCAQLGRGVAFTGPFVGERLAAVRRRGGVCEEIPCGVDLGKICGVVAASDAAPLVYAGRLSPHKRVDLLLRAVARLSGTGVLLDVLGDGPDRARLEALARDLGIVDKVRFFGRLATSEDIWKRMAGARVAVQPSAREGFGLFPLEAMALGVPVVSCVSPESAVGFVVGEGGFAVAPEPDVLAAAIARLLGDEDLWRAVSAKARARAQGYDWGRIATHAEVCFDRMREDRFDS